MDIHLQFDGEEDGSHLTSKNRVLRPKNFKAAVELQIRKYLDRLGGKDAELQELEKALWYTKFLVAYVKNKGPIRVKDIETILKG